MPYFINSRRRKKKRERTVNTGALFTVKEKGKRKLKKRKGFSLKLCCLLLGCWLVVPYYANVFMYTYTSTSFALLSTFQKFLTFSTLRSLSSTIYAIQETWDTRQYTLHTAFSFVSSTVIVSIQVFSKYLSYIYFHWPEYINE